MLRLMLMADDAGVMVIVMVMVLVVLVLMKRRLVSTTIMQHYMLLHDRDLMYNRNSITC